MTKKICKDIRSKIDKWLKTIDDKDLVIDLKSCIILSGGAISSLINNEQPNDYDIYLNNVDVARRLAEYYTKDLEINEKRIEEGYSTLVSTEFDDKSNCHRVILALHNPETGRANDLMIGNNGISKSDVEDYSLKYISANAITLHNDIQIILRFIGNIKDIHVNFDFIHNTNYYNYSEDKLVIHTDALFSLHTKELIYRGSLYPLCSMFRIRKFLDKGFKISAGQMLKIAMQINELDLKNRNILKEQLIGVDSAYFQHFIDEIDLGQDVTSNFIIELIDKFYDENIEYEK